ncbi:formyltetrahydrofolate deformylase [Alteribacillus persepolensis]|uniref:Formyltetrahydrofolate deformylase n=1 Tax=Alteribacillus persepolensis TaxID=568899 RepID=A0A1G8E4T5_9BACI|nr:formyltetrahydrofolate deformylase [Alteribacillus persepolensis]SDH64740.1 formyltetrahydrofolate deformylase [Alteribacillus persepolensis]
MKRTKTLNRARLLISCSDQPGIVASVSAFLHEKGANIVQSDQYSTDPEGGMFFMRVEFDLPAFTERFHEVEEEFSAIAAQFAMTWRLESERKTKRMAIFVSKEDHCLLELLWRWRSGELDVDIPLVISNHEDLRDIVESYGISFHYIPVTKETKQEAESDAKTLLYDYHIDFIVLARYMQILSPAFVQDFEHRIINIHHSFLPAFIGANPYKKAFERGVKLIGATAHYVTNDLDEGPIIEQEVLRVNHRYDTADLKIAGRNVEKIALARAVDWHINDKVLVHENKTIIFN